MNHQQAEQFLIDNPQKLKRDIISYIQEISSDWQSFEQNDQRPRILLRLLFLYYDYAFEKRNCSEATFHEEFTELTSEIAMCIGGWQGDIIELPFFLKD